MIPATSNAPQRFFRLQLSLRSLLILTLVCAVVMAWVYYEREKIAAKRAAVSVVSRNNGRVSTRPTRWSWVHRVLGDEFSGEVIVIHLGRENINEQLAAIERLPQELSWEVAQDSEDERQYRDWEPASLNIYVPAPFEDEDILEFANSQKVRGLYLTDSHVTDTGLAHVTQLRNLECLSLYGMKISDRGLANLHGLKSLKELNITCCPNITDAGVKLLRSIGPIEKLEIGPSITPLCVPDLAALDSLKSLDVSSAGLTLDDLEPVLRQFKANKKDYEIGYAWSKEEIAAATKTTPADVKPELTESTDSQHDQIGRSVPTGRSPP